MRTGLRLRLSVGTVTDAESPGTTSGRRRQHLHLGDADVGNLIQVTVSYTDGKAPLRA